MLPPPSFCPMPGEHTVSLAPCWQKSHYTSPKHLAPQFWGALIGRSCLQSKRMLYKNKWRSPNRPCLDQEQQTQAGARGAASHHMTFPPPFHAMPAHITIPHAASLKAWRQCSLSSYSPLIPCDQKATEQGSSHSTEN